MKFDSKHEYFHSRKCIWILLLQDGSYFLASQYIVLLELYTVCVELQYHNILKCQEVNKTYFIRIEIGHYLNQCWFDVYCTIRYKFQWNFNQNTAIFIQENVFENIICKRVAIYHSLNVFTDMLLYEWYCILAPGLKVNLIWIMI